MIPTSKNFRMPRKKISISISEDIAKLLEKEMAADPRISNLSGLIEYYVRLGYKQQHPETVSVEVSNPSD